MNLGIVVFSAIVLAYAFSLLPKQISPAVPGPLQVRTDLMRGQPCHVDNEVIMGDCSAGEIEALQRQAATP